MPAPRHTAPAGSRIPADAEIRTVSQLNTEVRGLLEDHFPSLWLTGEISNLAQPGSGHMYFSLKDDRAEIRCAMFRGQNRQLRFAPANGDQVVVHARATVYEPRGSYQLIVEHMEPAGEGLLLQQLEELKARLAAEGLFDDAHKQALPALPQCIGVITSPTGAAVRDILQILKRRFPAVPVIIYPVQVQGARAQHEIAAAISTATQRAECDVLIVGRGGGSLEDLWAFNEERVVRAIHDCPIPIVSAVGHEVDVTLADFAADVRAPTPSAAAELVVPDAAQWLAALRATDVRLAQALRRTIAQQLIRSRQLDGRLRRRHPGIVLQQHAQRLDELMQRADNALRGSLRQDHLRGTNLYARLRAAAPAAAIGRQRQALVNMSLRQSAAIKRQVAAHQARLGALAASLDGVSPLQTLQRGYAVVTDAQSGSVVRSVDALMEGQTITGRIADGSFDARIDKLRRT